MVRDAGAGTLAGGVGTVVMTAFMEPGLPRLLDPAWRGREFVPRQVVRWLDDTTPGAALRTHARETTAAAVAHLGYGAAMGALYGLLRGALRRSTRGGTARLHPLSAGALWGLAVWAAGYQGWLPAAGVRPATTEHPPRQWPIPIANHILYGVVVAQLLELTERPRFYRTDRGG